MALLDGVLAAVAAASGVCCAGLHPLQGKRWEANQFMAKLANKKIMAGGMK